ncbi:IS4 family transposase [Okeania sp. SIO2B3]|uniref:IS4 family transposase n=1 Tax=Okeania sp. SIO2B3 TaxID=2607784 RepID=UPI0013C174CD|nr:IS4 family transposase [Okeania sp. SIO2B3]NET46896.1 IS4 family transposase [Okeania sp. SIO2B3]
MNILGNYQDQIKQKLSPAQVETLKILLYLISVHKIVQISKLSAYFPLPIQSESRRKHIQRFLTLKQLSLPIFWFPLVKIMINTLLLSTSELVLVLDRTQWQNINILMISVVWKKRALPIYWKILSHKGASNLTEQQAVIRPMLRLLKKYQLILVGDREFHSIHLSYWLKNYRQKHLYFAFRQRKTTQIKRGSKYYQLQQLKVNVGSKELLLNQKITKIKQVSLRNLLIYKKRQIKQKNILETWYIISNLSSSDKIHKVYSQRMGIEAMFKDCQSGGYNLEETKANETRLNNLILLIAISYTISSFKGQKIKNQGIQKYISITNEKGRIERRHSSFLLGLYGFSWTFYYDFIQEWIENLIRLNAHKLPYYQRGIKAMSKINMLYNC